MKLFKSFLTISGLTFIARGTNFIRDLLFASVLGAGVYSDAFLTPLKLMSVLKSFFSDGPLGAVLVPAFINKNEQNERKIFAANILSSLIIITTIIVLLSILFAPIIIKLLMWSSAKTNPEKILLSTYLLRLMLPYCIFVSISSFIACLFQTKHKAWAFNIIALIVNCALIGGAWFAKNNNIETTQVPTLLSAILTFSAIIQIILLLILAKLNKIEVSLGKEFYLKERIKNFAELTKKFIPIVLSGCIDRTSSMISIVFANGIPGLYSCMHYANKIVHIPMYVIGTSMSAVFLPEMSTAIQEGNDEKVNFMQNRVIEFLIVLCLPVTLLHFIFSEEIVMNIFYRGKFTMENVLKTAEMLRIFSFSIPAMILSQTFTTGFFARQDTKTPMKIALFCFSINIIANLVCIKFFNRVEVALINNIMLWLDCTILFYVLCRKKLLIADNLLIENLNKISIATCIMLCTIFILNKINYILSFASHNTFMNAFTIIFTYCAAIYFLKVFEFKNFQENAHFLIKK